MKFKIKGIISYPHLFTARAVQGSDPKFSCSVLLPKNDPQIATVQAAIDAEKLNGFPSGMPANAKVCLHDCAVKFPDRPELVGYMVVTSTAPADRKPVVVGRDLQPVMDPAEVAAGDLAYFSLNTFPYSQPMSKGVSAGLNGVLILQEEGPLGKLGNQQTAESMFGDVAAGGPAANPTAPGATAAVPPVPPVPPVPLPTAAAVELVMTAAAQYTYRQYIDGGWKDEQLIAQGLAIQPSYAS